MVSNDNQEESEEGKREFCATILRDSILGKHSDLIMKTLMRMPMSDLKHIQSLLDHVIILESGSCGGTTKFTFTCLAEHEKETIELAGEQLESIKPVCHEAWVIMLVEDNLRDFSEPAKMYVIAQEFAHVYLKHDLGPVSDEQEADEQLLKWGFKKEFEAFEQEARLQREPDKRN